MERVLEEGAFSQLMGRESVGEKVRRRSIRAPGKEKKTVSNFE